MTPDAPITPAAFVRTLPDASPAEVVHAAAEAGLKLSETEVKKLRGLDKARAARWGNPAARSAPKKGAASPIGESKADYVRRVGAGLRPLHVVQRARMDGISLSANYVARVRAADKQRGVPDAPKAPAATPRPARQKRVATAVKAPKAGSTKTATSEAAFRATAVQLVLDVGIARATEILNDVVVRLRAAVG